MKLVRFGAKGAEKPGILDTKGRIRDLSHVVTDWQTDNLSAEKLAEVKTLDLEYLPLVPAETRLGPPVARPGKIVCCALTYAAHAAEANKKTPTDPMIMMIAPTALNGPFDDVIMPRDATKLDWEAELVIVIGKGGSYVPAAEALEHIAGFCTGNDLSERVFQLERGSQWTKGKSADTLKPLGPWLVTRDEVGDANQLSISMTVNDDVMQDAHTSDMAFSVAQLVSRISDYLTWEPGDLIFTGTPQGVGYGMTPQRYLNPGEIVSSSVEKLGTQRNNIRAYAAKE